MSKKYQTNGHSQNYARHLIRGNVTGNLGINSAVRFTSIYGESLDGLQVIRNLHRENVFRFWWYIICVLATIAMLIFFPSESWLAAIQLPVLMLNIDLVARGKVIGIYFGILDCIIYIIICAISGLWGEVIRMAAVNIPLNVVAIITWTKNLKAQKLGKYQEKTIEIRKLSVKGWLIYSLIFAVMLVVGYFGLGALGTNTLIISTLVFAIGVVVKILSSGRYMESYLLYIISQVVQIVMWISMMITEASFGSHAQNLVVCLACLTDGIYGYILWKSMHRKRTVNGGKLLVRRKVKINKVIKLRRMYKGLYWDKDTDISKNS